MEHTYLLVLLGILSISFGGLLLLNKRFGRYMHDRFWRPSQRSFAARIPADRQARYEGWVSVAMGVLMLLLWISVTHYPELPERCAGLIPLTERERLVRLLDQQAGSFASSTVSVPGRSAEGGSQTTFVNDGVRQIVEQRFYGETGRSYMRFYFNEGVIVALVKFNLSYASLIGVDPAASIASSEERDYYMDRQGNVCDAIVNGDPVIIDAEMQAMIDEYVGGIFQ